jgi:hypothetical protein
LQSGDEIAALDDEHSLVAAAPGVKERQRMPCRIAQLHFHVMFRRGHITGMQRDRACRQGESDIQRHCVIGRLSVRDAAFGGPHRLIR